LNVTRQKEMTDFEKFDRVMTGLMAVSYKELQGELAKHRKKKARKKRAKLAKTTGRGLSRDSGGEA
jgi:hypothetical protein